MNKRVSLVLAASSALGLMAWQKIDPKTLPAPYATPSATNPAKIVPRPEGAKLTVPDGFTATEFASGDFKKPRFLVEGPSGEVLVSDSVANGSVWLLVDKDHKGTAEKKPLLTGLDRPYGMAFWKEYLYVAEPTSIKRYKYDAKAMTAGAGEEVIALKGYDKGHFTRTLAFSPKGDKLYVSIGSSANVVTGDPENRAAISKYNPDGTGAEVVATGIRNPVGLHFYPGTETIWTSVQERDGLGDDLVPDYFTHVQPKSFYGWPYAYSGPHPEPRIEAKDQRPDLVDRSVTPDVLLQPHCAVLDFIFYTGKQFPAEYRGGAFLANHGSGNRSQRVGYSVSFIPFKNGKPSGPPRDFLTGYAKGPDEKEVWGRPVGLTQLRDGSLLMSEDGNRTIWRIAYSR